MTASDAARCGFLCINDSMGGGDEVNSKVKKVFEAVGPSAALVFAAWQSLQLLERRHDAARARYRNLVAAFGQPVEEKDGMARGRASSLLCATRIGMTAAFVLLLSLMISTLDAVSKADWLKLFGAPISMLRLLLVIPAAILLIMESTLARKLQPPLPHQ